MLALTAQSQLVTMWYTFIDHLPYDDGAVIAFPPDTQNWLDLTQLVVQWACSLLLYVGQSRATLRH
jgi:hypothetical protein